jgi:hypothetical protein
MAFAALEIVWLKTQLSKGNNASVEKQGTMRVPLKDRGFLKPPFVPL